MAEYKKLSDIELWVPAEQHEPIEKLIDIIVNFRDKVGKPISREEATIKVIKIVKH